MKHKRRGDGFRQKHKQAVSCLPPAAQIARLVSAPRSRLRLPAAVDNLVEWTFEPPEQSRRLKIQIDFAIEALHRHAGDHN